MDAATQAVGARAEFTGHPGRFFRIALVGNLLQLPTFGFYRFWLITDIRRHLWSHTRIGGEAFEYTGRGRELLIGFLIAMAILMPIYVGYFLLGIEVERWQAFGSLPLFFLIYVLIQYGTFRARRYRATRTIFRGVRLWMMGSGWRYAGRAILWDLLTLITLGLALPWRFAALERYKMQNTFFGDLQGTFTGSGWVLFKHGWWLWFTVIIVLFGGLTGSYYFLTTGVVPMAVAAQGASLLPMVLVLTGMVIVYPLFRAIEMRWWLDGIRFGDLLVSSTLKKRSVWWCYLKALLIGAAFLGVSSFAFGATLAGLDISWAEIRQGTTPPPSVIAAVVCFYFIVLLGLAVIILQFVTRGVWQLATNSVTVSGFSALDAVAARGVAAGSLGEGLADALDFGGMGV